MSIQQFHNTLRTEADPVRSFQRLRELGVAALKPTGRNWEPWTRTRA